MVDQHPVRAGPAVSIVIVTLDEGDYLRQTVEAMWRTTPPGTEIVVVDDGSTDGSLDFLEDHPEVVIARSDRRMGIAVGRNFGARRSAGEVIVFSDAHVVPSEGWLQPLVDTLADPAVGEVTTAIGHLAPGVSSLGYGFTWGELSLRMKWLNVTSAVPIDVPFICGCFLAMRRDVFEEVGGFDEGMYRWGSEDAELSLRLWMLGYKCQCVSSVSARHLFREAFPYAVDQSGILSNTLRLAVVHLDEPAIDRVVRHHSRRPAFPRAWATLVEGDAWQRRDEMDRRRRRTARWFIRHFGIDVLA